MSPAPKKPIVCYVTDRRTLDPADPVASVRESIRMALVAGADWVQVREKDLPGRTLLAIVREAVAVAASAAAEMPPGGASRTKQACVIVNDRLDVALAGGAGGVHLGRESLAAREVTAWRRRGNAGAEFSIGASCHSLEEARVAESDGASYVFFGPVFDTPSKKAFGKAQGLAKLAEVCGAVRIPVIAIGGVSAENAVECIRVGAAGVAAIRLFQEASDLNELKDALERIHRCD